MLDLNVYTAALLPTVFFVSYLVYLRLRKPLEYRLISSHVPSVTKTLWSEVTFSLSIAMKHPRGTSRCAL